MRQAALCYEIAATIAPEQATSMIRLGDTYAALAMDPDRLPPSIIVPTEKYAKPHRKKCGRRCSSPIPSLTHTLPSMQAFRCDSCGETLIWKSARPKSAEGPSASALPSEGDRWITRYVAVSFRQVGVDFVPSPAIECPDDSLAIQRAELMMCEKRVAGAVAFSRRSDPTSEELEDAVILEIFGAIPEESTSPGRGSARGRGAVAQPSHLSANRRQERFVPGGPWFHSQPGGAPQVIVTGFDQLRPGLDVFRGSGQDETLFRQMTTIPSAKDFCADDKRIGDRIVQQPCCPSGTPHFD